MFLERDEAGRVRHFDAQWNDDVHHVLHAAVTGEGSGYYAEYRGDTEKLGRAVAEGFAFQGEIMEFRGSARGEPSADLPPTAFVAFLQNHDQIGNRAFGERIGALATPEAIRAVTAIYLLLPQVPLLFMGEEWDAPQPFLFFTDMPADLADAVREGRRAEFARFAEFADPERRERIPDPQALSTNVAAKLQWQDPSSPANARCLERYRRLLEVRRREIVPRLAAIRRGGRYTVLGKGAISAEWQAGNEVLGLVANLTAAPVQAAPAGGRKFWQEGEIAADGRIGPWALRWTIRP
jgi:maltooligosyltrehalose trehalohydrolase